MDSLDYKQMYGEPKTLEQILEYCAYLAGQSGLEHRTLHLFNYFVSALIFGDGYQRRFQREYPEEQTPLETAKDYHIYAYSKKSVDDIHKIFTKYGHLRAVGEQDALLKYARAFMDYCESQYAPDHVSKHVSEYR